MDSFDCTYDVLRTLPKNNYTKDEYVFKGWATSQANADIGKVAFQDGQKILNLTTTNGAVVNLYAVWDKPKVLSTFANISNNWGGNINQWVQIDGKWHPIIGAWIQNNNSWVKIFKNKPTVDGFVINKQISINKGSNTFTGWLRNKTDDLGWAFIDSDALVNFMESDSWTSSTSIIITIEGYGEINIIPNSDDDIFIQWFDGDILKNIPLL